MKFLSNRRTSLQRVPLFVGLFSVVAAATAQIVRDGTVGPAGALTGPAFQIRAQDGRHVGANLFHSFKDFNVGAGESATFSGPASVRNILSRVTGGMPSQIDGSIHSTIPGANLYLLNPSGVMFGPQASIDVSGAFVVGTADYVKLSDGGRFDVLRPSESILTTAPPSAFGFLNRQPAAVTFSGTRLRTQVGQSMTVAGGNIELNDARLEAPSGRANLVSVASPGEVQGDLGDLTVRLQLTDFTQLGRITLDRTAEITSVGDGAGAIFIRGGQLILDGKNLGGTPTIKAESRGHSIGAIIDIGLSEKLVADWGAEISTRDTSSAEPGYLRIRAQNEVRVDHRSQIAARTVDSGYGATISIEGTRLHVADDSKVTTQTLGRGRAGNIVVRADEVFLNRGGALVSDVAKAQQGIGGTIDVKAKSVTLRENSRILTFTEGADQAGHIFVEAENIDVAGRVLSAGSANNSVIQSSSGYRPLSLNEPVQSGNGGNVYVKAKNLRLADGGRLITSAYQNGTGGNLHVEAEHILISGGGVANSAGIVTESGHRFLYSDDPRRSLATAGQVSITAATLKIEEGGEIATRGFGGEGLAGNIDITAGQIDISGLPYDRRAYYPQGGILSLISTRVKRSNSGGDVNIHTDRMRVLENGLLYSLFTLNNAKADPKFTAGRGGNFNITGGDIVVSGVGAEMHTRVEVGVGGTATGGGFHIKADNVLVEKGGRISSVADTYNPLPSGESYAGPISIKSKALTISDEVASGRSGLYSRAIDSTESGSITLEADEFVLRDRGTISIVGVHAERPSGLTVQARTAEIASGGTIETSGVLGENLSITASESVLIHSGGGIHAETTSFVGSDFFGAIVLTAPTVRLEGARSGVFARSSNVGLTPEQREAGGDLTIQTDRLEVRDGALISGRTTFRGDGGKILVVGADGETPTQQILITGPGSGIVSDSVASGPEQIIHAGGDIRLYTFNLLLTDRGQISTATFTAGPAGTILIEADRAMISDGSSISSSSYGAGKGGDIMITARRARIADHASISAGSFAAVPESGTVGAAGSITVHASDSIVVAGGSTVATEADNAAAGNVYLSAGQQIRIEESRITAVAKDAGGNITLLAPAVRTEEGIAKSAGSAKVYLRASVLAAESREGQGGNIVIDPQFVVLNDAKLSANAVRGNGGSIDIVSDVFLQSAGRISAASELGLPGAVTILAPDLDLSGSFVPLTATLLDGESQLPEYCGRKFPGDVSSFVVLGRGGLPADLSWWQSSSGIFPEERPVEEPTEIAGQVPRPPVHRK